MAQVNRNLVTTGLSGLLGDQIVLRNLKGGRTIVAMKPTHNPNREASPSQEAHQEAFRHAAAYGKAAKTNPIYKAKAEGTTMSPYNAAVADWFNEPEVLEIDTTSLTGQIGDAVMITAQDDTQVMSVRVEIYSASGGVLEQGVASKAEGLLWIYTTTTPLLNEAGLRVVAFARDLPGHIGELTWEYN